MDSAKNSVKSAAKSSLKNSAKSKANYVLVLGVIALASSSLAIAKRLPAGNGPQEQTKVRAMQGSVANQSSASNRPNVAQAVADAQKRTSKIYVYEFGASWCPNCTAIKPMMHEVGSRYRERVQLVEIDTDDAKNDQLVDQFSVQKLPTIVVIRPNGTIAARYVGRDEAKRLEGELSAEVSKLNSTAGPQSANKGIQTY